MIKTTLFINPYNLEKADWKKFYDTLRIKTILLIEIKLKDLSNKKLKTFATIFQKYIINSPTVVGGKGECNQNARLPRVWTGWTKNQRIDMNCKGLERM